MARIFLCLYSTSAVFLLMLISQFLSSLWCNCSSSLDIPGSWREISEEDEKCNRYTLTMFCILLSDQPSSRYVFFRRWSHTSSRQTSPVRKHSSRLFQVGQERGGGGKRQKQRGCSGSVCAPLFLLPRPRFLPFGDTHLLVGTVLLFSMRKYSQFLLSHYVLLDDDRVISQNLYLTLLLHEKIIARSMHWICPFHTLQFW